MANTSAVEHFRDTPLFKGILVGWRHTFSFSRSAAPGSFSQHSPSGSTSGGARRGSPPTPGRHCQVIVLPSRQA
eukprot:1196136-Prorocentrum_minimum.AAC.8